MDFFFFYKIKNKQKEQNFTWTKDKSTTDQMYEKLNKSQSWLRVPKQAPNRQKAEKNTDFNRTTQNTLVKSVLFLTFLDFTQDAC